MRLTCFQRWSMLHSLVLVVALAAIICPTGEISAALVDIPDIYNTGVDDAGQKLSNLAPEQHYMLTGVTGAASDAFVISDDSKPGPWTPSDGESAWIGPVNGNSEAAAGTYVYTLQFSLDGLDPSTAEISGRWATDNGSEIFLNDEYTGFSRTIVGFVSLEPFNINTGFVPGINTLECEVNNPSRGPTGLLALDMSGTASEVPIPAAVWLLGSALIALFVVRKKQRI